MERGDFGPAATCGHRWTYRSGESISASDAIHTKNPRSVALRSCAGWAGKYYEIRSTERAFEHIR